MSTTMDTREKPVITGYDPEIRLYASRYVQGGRTTYSLDLSLAQVAGLLPAPDPANPQPGNRRIVPSHANAFGNYIREHAGWFSQSIALRSTSEFKFEPIDAVGGTEIGVVSLPFMALTEIHIIDGQHRILGIHNGLRQITSELERTRATLARLEKRKVSAEDEAEKLLSIETLKTKADELAEQRARFEKERVAVQLVVENDPAAYQQMFFDSADNQLRMKISVKVRFDTRRVVNRVLQDVIDHPLLAGRVDLESDVLTRQNENLLSAKHVAELIRIIAVGVGGRMGKRVEQAVDEDELRDKSMSFFDILAGLEPFTRVVRGQITPNDLRNSTIVASPAMLRILAGSYRELSRDWTDNKIESFYASLMPSLDKPASKDLVRRTGDLFFPGALSPNSRRQDLVAFTQIMSQWAEKWEDTQSGDGGK